MRIPLTTIELEQYLKKILPLKAGFDLLGDHVVITDENANILYANKAVERNTGFSANEVIGKNPGDLWGGEMPKEFYEKMWHTIKEEKKPFVGEVKNVRKDGTEYWQELHISPIFDERNEVQFFIGIEPNITERKEREKFREEFVSMLGHQLRNPLTTIQWIVEYLLKYSGITEEDKEKLETIYQEEKNLSKFITDLLMLARMEKGALRSEMIRLDEELAHYLNVVRQKWPAISFSFKNKVGSVALTTIKSLALQVFLNIMHNAAEHADVKHGAVVITLREKSQKIIFSCHNNGEPIPDDIQPHIFSKLPHSTGEGLGLFLVKMICDYFGWQISFETGDKGTTFDVVLPS